MKIIISALTWDNNYIVRVVNDEDKLLGSYTVNASELIDKKVVSRPDFFSKVEKYLNTDDGFKYATGINKEEFSKIIKDSNA